MFPDRDAEFELLDNPSSCVKGRTPVSGTDSDKQRRLSRGNKSDPMMQDQTLDREHLSDFSPENFQLVFSHCLVGFVVDSGDVFRSFQSTNHAPKIDDTACCVREDWRWGGERSLANDDVDRVVCHIA